MDIIEKAIKQNEIKELLEGKGEYKLENNSMTSFGMPIDWTIVIPQLYNEYLQNPKVMTMYSNAIKDMLLGSGEEVYCAIAVFYFQVLREEGNRSPYRISREYFIPLVREALERTEEEFKNNDNLFREVIRYKKLFKFKFGICF